MRRNKKEKHRIVLYLAPKSTSKMHASKVYHERMILATFPQKPAVRQRAFEEWLIIVLMGARRRGHAGSRCLQLVIGGTMPSRNAHKVKTT